MQCKTIGVTNVKRAIDSHVQSKNVQLSSRFTQVNTHVYKSLYEHHRLFPQTTRDNQYSYTIIDYLSKPAET